MNLASYQCKLNLLNKQDLKVITRLNNCDVDYILKVFNVFIVLSSTYTLSQYIKIMIISAFSMNLLSSSVVIYYGASIVGIYFIFKKYKSISDVANYINIIIFSIYIYIRDQLICNNFYIDLLYQNKIFNNLINLYSQ